MEMCYDEALVMPSNSVNLEEDEMEYVEGGRLAYLDNSTCKAICSAALLGGAISYGSAASVAADIIGAGIPVAGWITAALITTYAVGFSVVLVTAALTSTKGVGIYLQAPTGLSFRVE